MPPAQAPLAGTKVMGGTDVNWQVAAWVACTTKERLPPRLVTLARDSLTVPLGGMTACEVAGWDEPERAPEIWDTPTTLNNVAVAMTALRRPQEPYERRTICDQVDMFFFPATESVRSTS